MNDALICRKDVLDLSISLRTGKEINIDFCSSGERTRKSPDGNMINIVRKKRKNNLERLAKEGDSPLRISKGDRVELFGSAV